MRRALAIALGLAAGATLTAAGRFQRFTERAEPGRSTRGFIGASSTGAHQLMAGLTHYWAFEGSSLDSIGGASGTDTAIVYSSDAGVVGQGAVFDGASSKIQTLIAGPTGATPRSISIWVRPTNGAVSVVFEYGTATAGQLFQLFRDTASTLSFSAAAVVAQTSLGFGAWVHFVVVYDGTTAYLYKNGAAPITAVYSLNTVASINMLFGSHAGAFFFPGAMDEVGFWDGRALSADDVAYLYNGGAGRSLPFQ